MSENSNSLQNLDQSLPSRLFPQLPKTPEELHNFLKNAPKRGTNKLRTVIRKRLFLDAYVLSWGKNYFSADAAGVSPVAVLKWKNEDPDFAAEIEHIEGLMADQIEIVIDEKILIGKDDNWLLKKLQILRPDKYAPKVPTANFTGTLTLKLDESSDDDNEQARKATQISQSGDLSDSTRAL